MNYSDWTICSNFFSSTYYIFAILLRIFWLNVRAFPQNALISLQLLWNDLSPCSVQPIWDTSFLCTIFHLRSVDEKEEML